MHAIGERCGDKLRSDSPVALNRATVGAMVEALDGDGHASQAQQVRAALERLDASR